MIFSNCATRNDDREKQAYHAVSKTSHADRASVRRMLSHLSFTLYIYLSLRNNSVDIIMNLTILVDRYVLKSFPDSVVSDLIIKTGRNLLLSSRFLFFAFTSSLTLSVNSSSPCIARSLHFLLLRLLEAEFFQSRRKLRGLIHKYCTRVRWAVSANALLQTIAVILTQLKETAIGKAQCIASFWTYSSRRTAWSMQCAIQTQHRSVNSETVSKLLILSRIVNSLSIHCRTTWSSRCGRMKENSLCAAMWRYVNTFADED